MMNSKVRRVLMLAACAVLLVAMSVGATLAYLTANTLRVENTFTVGNVSFNEAMNGGLDEAEVDEYGENPTADRTTENEYKLVPGHTYIKDPTVHLDADSENLWLFVKVENGIATIESEEEAEPTIAEQMAANNWVQLTVDGVAVPNVYYYNGIIDFTATNADGSVKVDFEVFNHFYLADDADVGSFADENGNVDAIITIQAYAIQADNFTTAEAAWKADPCEWPANPTTP